MGSRIINSTLRLLAAGWLASASSIIAAEPAPQVRTLQPGVRFSLVAEHPALVTPTGIDVDAQGHVWLVASHTHFRPKNYTGPAHDEILMFDDRAGGNPARTRRVFYNATDATMDLELGPGGWVYLAERDRILRVKDTDGDGKGDLEENLAVLSSESDYPHNGLSGLAWHPDGDLFFGLGENFAKPWTLTGRDKAEIKGIGEGGIFRCRPDGSQLRRVARGFWNPFGICVRNDGEIFAADNDPGERPPCRLLHIVQGGDYGYQRQYGGEAHHPFVGWNGELRGTLPMIHPTGEAPCGVTPLRGGVVVPSWSDHQIDFFPLRRKGASFTAGRIVLVSGGFYFRPVCIAPDRSRAGSQSMTWYLTDWVSGAYELHGLGRLWKLEIDPTKATWLDSAPPEPPTKAANLAAQLRSGANKSSRNELLRFARDPDPFLARAALLALARQAPDWKPEDVRKLSARDRVQALLALKLAADPSQSGAPQRIASEEWVRHFLKDSDADVQFETLRWIAEAQLTQFLPMVETTLKRSDLGYRSFEAAMATWNILSGKPEMGVRNAEMLLGRVQDASSAPRIRAYALRLLPLQPRAAATPGAAPVLSFPKGLTVELLKQLLAVGDPLLSLETVRTLAGNPAAGQRVLAGLAADSGQPAGLRAEAAAGLAAVAHDHLPLLVQLAGEESRALREEALRSLRNSTLVPDQTNRLRETAKAHPDSADLVRAVFEPASLGQNRPDLTDTAGWLKRLKAVKGPADPESGRRIFQHANIALCSRCHRHSGRGNVVGPDLSAVAARGDHAWLLESLLQPSREIAPEYLPRMVVLKDGTEATGIRLRSWVMEQLRDANGLTLSYKLEDIESIRDLATSFMPEGLVYSLTDRELRDLIAFLESPATNEASR